MHVSPDKVNQMLNFYLKPVFLISKMVAKAMPVRTKLKPTHTIGQLHTYAFSIIFIS